MAKPVCKLIGEDGNVFNVIALVSRALKEANFRLAAEEFKNKAFSAGSYDEVLQLAMKYVDVQ